MMYLPDTNIFIRALYGLEPEATFLKMAISKGKLVISVIVIAEFYPKAQSREIVAFDELVASIGSLPIDENIAKIAGEYRREFLRKTKRAFLLDCFLAAQTRLHHLGLVTNNKADFPMKDIKVITPK